MVDGITTLLACLLVRLDMPIELERLVSSSAPIRVEVVERGLQERGDLHALAVLYTHNGREADALKTWQVRSLWIHNHTQRTGTLALDKHPGHHYPPPLPKLPPLSICAPFHRRSGASLSSHCRCLSPPLSPCAPWPR